MSWSKRQSPSVTMSRPATSCSRNYPDSASTYCSRNRDVTIASRNDRVPRFSVYQLGRGSEPVIVVGSMIPAVAFNRSESPRTDRTFERYTAVLFESTRGRRLMALGFGRWHADNWVNGQARIGSLAVVLASPGFARWRRL